jgi:hypothetical protein
MKPMTRKELAAIVEKELPAKVRTDMQFGYNVTSTSAPKLMGVIAAMEKRLALLEAFRDKVAEYVACERKKDKQALYADVAFALAEDEGMEATQV